MRESYLLKSIVRFLNDLRERGEEIFWFKTKGDPVGIPDLIICYKGKFMAIELKTYEGKLRPAQMYVMSQISKAGGECYVVRSIKDLQLIFKGSDNVVQSSFKHRRYSQEAQSSS